MWRSRHFILRVLLLGVVVSSLVMLVGCGGLGGGYGDIGPIPSYWSVAVGDLNGDGRMDIANCFSILNSSQPNAGFVAVNLQDPVTPGKFLTPATYRVDADPLWIAIGDLNGDGKLDIVTANAVGGPNATGPNDVSVLLQDASNPGKFLPASTYATGNYPESVAIGDLNGDGKPDLAVADNSGLSVLVQDPAKPGSFLPRSTLNIGSGTSSVAIGDLNGDGKLDLIATSTNVLVLLQNPSVPGVFSVPVSYAAGHQPDAVAVADLNGDGKPDLAVSNLGSPDGLITDGVSVLLQNPSTPGTFLAATNYARSLATLFVASADLNGDGNADLAVGSFANIVSVLLQDPGSPGQFQPATNYSGTDDNSKLEISSLAIADMNGDSKPDLVIDEAFGVAILFQNPSTPGAFLPATGVPQ